MRNIGKKIKLALFTNNGISDLEKPIKDIKIKLLLLKIYARNLTQVWQ